MIEPIEAAVVRQIFELAAVGVGYTGIAKRLNSEGAPCPRAQRNRPAGWAPSSVREVLLRPIYRGEIVWNQSRKRDSWGQHRQRPRPEAEWLRIDAPELRIVSDELWKATHHQMAQRRARSSGPVRYEGPKNSKTAYLLTGLLKCGVCGAGMEVRRQKHGRVRVSILHCSAHWRKGKDVCTNARTVVMAHAETVILDALREALLDPDVLEAAIHRAAARLSTDQNTSDLAAAELRQLDAELARLTDAIAAGGDAPALVQAIQVREERRRTVHRQVQARARTASALDLRAITTDLRTRVQEWRTLLDATVPEARALLRLLVIDRLTMKPTRDG